MRKRTTEELKELRDFFIKNADTLDRQAGIRASLPGLFRERFAKRTTAEAAELWEKQFKQWETEAETLKGEAEFSRKQAFFLERLINRGEKTE